MRTLLPFLSSFLMGIGLKMNQLVHGKGATVTPPPPAGGSTFFWLGF